MLSDKEAGEIFKLFADEVNDWARRLKLNGRYELKTKLIRGKSSDLPGDMHESIASSIVSWYDPATEIRLHVDNLPEDWDDEYIELLALHEISHIMVAPMMTDGEDRTKKAVELEEMAVEVVSRSLREAYRSGIDAVKGIPGV